jgi:hypothetical protein
MSYILNIQMLSLLNISDLEGLGSDSQERKLKLYELNKNLLEVSKQVLLCNMNIHWLLCRCLDCIGTFRCSMDA